MGYTLLSKVYKLHGIKKRRITWKKMANNRTEDEYKKEKKTAEVTREGQERRVQDHLLRRSHVHEVGVAEDGVLPAKAEPEHRQVVDKRASSGAALRHLPRERIRVVHVVSLICEHSEVQGVPH